MSILAIINWVVWFFIAKKMTKDKGCFVFLCVWCGGVVVTAFVIGLIFATFCLMTGSI